MLATIDFTGTTLTFTLGANEKVVVSNPGNNQVRFNVTPYSPGGTNGGGLSFGGIGGGTISVGGGTLWPVSTVGDIPVVPTTGVTSVSGAPIGFSVVGYGTDTTGTLPAAVSLVIKGASGSAQAVDFQQSSNGAFVTSSRISVDLGNDANDDVTFSGAIDRTGVVSGDAIKVTGVSYVSFRESISVGSSSVAITASATPISSIAVGYDAIVRATTGNVAVFSEGSVNVYGTITTAGSVEATSSGKIVVVGNITAGRGGVALIANQQALRTPGSFVGIDVFGGIISTTANGNISLRGRGGSYASSVRNPDGHGHGVRITRGGMISATGTGEVIIAGVGGLATGEPTISQSSWPGSSSAVNVVMPLGLNDTRPSTNVSQVSQGSSNRSVLSANTIVVSPINFSHGVLIDGNATNVSAESGSIHITGHAGNDASSHGVYVNSALVESRGDLAGSSISITGTTSTSRGYKVGVLLDGGVKSESAPIIITGQGPGASVGFESRQAAFVKSTGTSGISITGAGTTKGVLIGRYSTVAATSGLVDLVGDARTPGSVGLAIESGATASSVHGSLRLIGDTIEIDGATIAAKTVGLQPRTPAARIDLGGADRSADALPTLGLTDNELNRVFAETLTIGAADAGELVVTAPIALSRPTDVVVRSGGGIAYAGGSVNTGGKSLVLDPGASPSSIKPLTSGFDATASVVDLESALAVTINGQTPDSEYSRLRVSGAVNLTGVDLVLSGTNTRPGEFVIVEAMSVTGTFKGLPHGSSVTLNGEPLVVYYHADRVVLASPSNVTAGLLGRGLAVTGGAASDSVQILPGPAPRSYVVKGLGHTTVNGQASVTVRNVTAGWRINLGQGGDTLVVGDGASPVTVAGAVQINVGALGTMSQVILNRLTVSAGLTIRSGSGSSAVGLTRVVVGGQFTFSGGAGDEQLAIQGSRFQQHAKMSFGRGSNRVTVTGTAFQRTVAIDFAQLAVNEIDAGLRSAPLGRSRGNVFAVRPQVVGPVRRVS